MSERFDRITAALVLGGALALLGDLFLDWRNVTVDLPLVHVDAGSSGWASWGAIAGVLVLGLIGWEIARRLGVRTAGADGISAILALGTLVFVVVRFLEDATDVSVAATVDVGESARQWPAYVGVVLAVVVAGAALTRLVPQRGHHGRAVTA
jgi:hypothetical protein